MPIPLRSDYDATDVRAAARRAKDGPQARRLLALAAIYDGASRTEAARIGGVTLQIVRDWVVKFNAEGAAGLINRKPPGQPSRLTDEDRAAVAAVIESGPIPAVHGVVRWRVIDLCAWFWSERGVRIAKQTLSRELRRMGYRQLSARPRHHAQAEGAIEHLKKSRCPSARNRARQGHRPFGRRGLVRRRGPHRGIGQKNKITRRWARRGTRPSAPHDQRTASTYIFGAICPQEGKAARLVLPWCNTAAMAHQLAEISRQVRPSHHAALLLDQAGWHTSAKLDMPANITIVPLPPKCPELNPQENVWQFLRDNWLSNRKRPPRNAALVRRRCADRAVDADRSCSTAVNR